MLSEFTRDKSRAHLVMLAAIVLQFVSYFFLYGDGSDGSSSMVVGPDFSGSTVFFGFGGAPHGTGWENNLLGWPILVVLAFVFLSSQVYSNPLFQKYAGGSALFWSSAAISVATASAPSAPLLA